VQGKRVCRKAPGKKQNPSRLLGWPSSPAGKELPWEEHPRPRLKSFSLPISWCLCILLPTRLPERKFSGLILLPGLRSLQDKPRGTKAGGVWRWELPIPPFPHRASPPSHPIPSHPIPAAALLEGGWGGLCEGPGSVTEEQGALGSSPHISAGQGEGDEGDPDPGAHRLVLLGRASRRPSEARQRSLWLNGCGQIYSGC